MMAPRFQLLPPYTRVTLSDVVDYRNSRWWQLKLEMEITIERNEFATPIATANHTFVTAPDSSMTLPTLPDVRWLPEFKMTATTFGFDGRHIGSRPTSDNVDRVISESGMVENVG